jgi:fibronectin-binding autotransporter adhesin
MIKILTPYLFLTTAISAAIDLHSLSGPTIHVPAYVEYNAGASAANLANLSFVASADGPTTYRNIVIAEPEQLVTFTGCRFGTEVFLTKTNFSKIRFSGTASVFAKTIPGLPYITVNQGELQFDTMPTITSADDTTGHGLFEFDTDEAVTLILGEGVNFTGNIHLNGTGRLNVQSIGTGATISGKISGTGGIEIVGLSPNITLSGPNTFTGSLKTNLGATLTLSHLNAITTATQLILNGGSVIFNVNLTTPLTMPVTIFGNQTLLTIPNSMYKPILSGPISYVDGYIDIVGPGSLQLAGTTPHTSQISCTSGKLEVTSSVALGTGKIILRGGVLSVIGLKKVTEVEAFTLLNPFEIRDTSMVFVESNKTVTLNSPIVNAEGDSNRYNLSKQGLGTLVLQGNNSGVGSFVLQAGKVRVEDDGALGSGVLNINPLAAAGAAAAAVPVLDMKGNVTLTQDISITGKCTVSGTAGGLMTLSGAITCASEITLDCQGILAITKASPGFIGKKTITSGTLSILENGCLGPKQPLPNLIFKKDSRLKFGTYPAIVFSDAQSTFSLDS